MKKIFAMVAMLSMIGCTTETKSGSCVGILDLKTPGLKYELSYRNVFMGVIFSETIIVPAVVILKELECPN